jgi:hypothetical protein
MFKSEDSQPGGVGFKSRLSQSGLKFFDQTFPALDKQGGKVKDIKITDQQVLSSKKILKTLLFNSFKLILKLSKTSTMSRSTLYPKDKTQIKSR